MLGLSKEDNKKLMIALVIIIIVIIIYVIGRRSYKKSHTVEDLPLPNEEKYGKDLNETEAAQVKDLAERLYSSIDGVAWLGHDYQLWRDTALLSDRLLVAVYNYYNDYMKAKGKFDDYDMIESIDEEKFSWDVNPSTETNAKNIVSRLKDIKNRGGL